MDLLYPSNIKCISCNDNISKTNTYSLCKKCFNKIEFIQTNCLNCGVLCITEICDECIRNNIISKESKLIDEIYSCCVYEDIIEKLVHGYKYSSKTFLSRQFSDILKDKYQSLRLEVDYLTTIPTTLNRIKKRGYNHTDILAKQLSTIMNIQYIKPIIKIKETKPLAKLNALERYLEINGVFKIEDKTINLNYKKMLIIDDIFTTGITASELAKTIKEEYPYSYIILLTLSTAKL